MGERFANRFKSVVIVLTFFIYLVIIITVLEILNLFADLADLGNTAGANIKLHM